MDIEIEALNLEMPYYKIGIETSNEKLPTLLDVTNFIYDINMIYEINRLAFDEKYDYFNFSYRLYQRNGRPLHDADRLRTLRIKEESPLTIEAIIGIVGVILAIPSAVYSTICIYEKICGKKCTSQTLEKPSIQTQAKDPTQIFLSNREQFWEQAEDRLRSRQAYDYVMQIIKRIEKSRFKIEKILLEIENTTSEFKK